uniref:Uncharacterized protein n=1 Tax=Plectus sambesii TaxID=2011161 RepID=A0A914UJC1_9BILA
MVKVRRIATLQPAKPIAHITPSRAATINALQKLGMPDNKPGRLQSGKRRSSRVPLQRVPFVPATGPAYIRNAKATPKPKKIATKATKVNKASALKPKVARKAAGKRAKPTDEETEASDNEDGNAKPKAKKKRVEKAKKEKGEKKDKKEKKEKVVKEKKTRNKNDKLVPRPNVTQYDKDPTFELKEQIPFVSVSAYSKLAIRAVLTKNEGLLKRLIDDKDHCASILLERSKFVPKSAISYAIRAEDSKMIDLIKQGQEKIEKEGSTRVRMEKNLLQSMNTGRANYRMLGHATRAIQMTRGAKEGNNAFVLYEPEHDEANHYLGDMLEDNISFDFIQTLVAKQYVNSHQLQSNIYKAVRMGHRKLAGKLIETYATHYFNELHIQALLNDKQALKKFMPISVKKKGRENKDFTPIHAACINPNDAYLKDMIAVESDFNHADADGWRSIHYAAVCEGTKPLQLLLSKGASVYDITKQHDTPLHAAARAG